MELQRIAERDERIATKEREGEGGKLSYYKNVIWNTDIIRNFKLRNASDLSCYSRIQFVCMQKFAVIFQTRLLNVGDPDLDPGFIIPVVHFNLLKSTGHVMHRQFNIQQLYALPTLYLCVLYLSENKQRLVPLTA